jgi:hypothetical protein
VQDALEPERSGLDPGAAFAQEPPAFGGVVGREQLADRFQRDFEVAQPDDRPAASSWSRW